RFIALLLEHTAGALPLWLAPVQAIVLPIADRHAEYATAVRDRLAAAGLRVEIDPRQEKGNYKIPEAPLSNGPYKPLIGERQGAEGTIAVRSRSGGDLGARGVDDFIRDAQAEIASKGAVAETVAAAP